MFLKRLCGVLIILSMILAFASCKKEPSAVETATEAATDAEPVFNRIDYENIARRLDLPYKAVGSLTKYGSFVYFSAAEDGNADSPYNLLIKADAETGDTEIIAKLESDTHIDYIGVNDSYLVYSVKRPPYNKTKLFLTNLKNGGVKEIYPEESDSFGKLIPRLLGDSIYWLEKNQALENLSVKSVIKYGCETGARVELHSLYSDNSKKSCFYLGDGYVLWDSYINGELSYFLHSIEERKTRSIKAKGDCAEAAVYAGGYIFSAEADEESGKTVDCIIDAESGEYLSDEVYIGAAESIRASGAFIYAETRYTKSFYKVEEKRILSLGRLPDSFKGEVFPAENGFMILQKGEDNKSTVLILDFSQQ